MNMEVDLETNTALHSHQAVLAVEGRPGTPPQRLQDSGLGTQKDKETGHCCYLYRTFKHMR